MSLTQNVWFKAAPRKKVLSTSLKRLNRERMRCKLAAASFVSAPRLIDSTGKRVKG